MALHARALADHRQMLSRWMGGRRLRAATVRLAGAIAVGMTGWPAARQAAPAPAPPAAPASAPPAWPSAAQRCHLPGWSGWALCGSVPRPLDPARPQGPVVAVHYAVLPALARRKAPDPLVFLAGGPGQSAIDLAGAMAARFAPLNQRRDLILVDQRGTGRSAPLDCPDDLPQAGGGLSLAEQLDEPARLQRLARCRQALQRLPHGDLRFYATPYATADLEAVRVALGVARWNLVGASYGTRAGLDYLRQHPQAVRRLLLDGVVPPDMRLPQAAALDNQAAWQAVLDGCRAETACAQRHPTLAAQWQRLLDGLPRDVQLAHPVSGAPETVRLTREQVLGAVRGALYAPWVAAALPEAVAQAANGRFQALMGLSSVLLGGAGLSLSTGMHFSVVCSEDVPSGGAPSAPTPATPAMAPGQDLLRLYAQACADWPRASVPAAFYRVGASPAPVWLLSGGLDPVTPPRHAARMALALGPLARHSVVASWGHGVLGVPCAREAVQRFIETEDDGGAAGQADAALATCAAGLPRPIAFVAPGGAAGAGVAAAASQAGRAP